MKLIPDDLLTVLAAQLYVRLRREASRVIDVIWLTQDAVYAREVLRLANALPGREVRELAARYEALMFGAAPPAQAEEEPEPRRGTRFLGEPF